MKLILTLSLFLTTFCLYSQDHRCGTGMWPEDYGKETHTETSNQSFFRTHQNIVNGIIYIPVVVHVIHDNVNGAIAGENISDEQVHSQIKILNEDFGRFPGSRGYNEDPRGTDTEIRFCLADRDPNGFPTKGIVRVYNSKATWSYSDNIILNELSHWPADRYLNITVANLSSDWLAWAQFPQSDSLPGVSGSFSEATDGVVIDYQAFGSIGDLFNNYNLGRTATHEVGHWLGLLHIWGSGTCGNDYVDDTPWDYKSNQTKTCRDSSDCDMDGVYTEDIASNYMDYSYDRCMNIFTVGQKQRIIKALTYNPRRNALLSSQGCSGISRVEDKLSKSILTYPNPVEASMNVSFITSCSGKVVIYNSINEELKSFFFSEQDNLSVDLSELKSGFYMLVLETDKGRFVQKVVKK